MNFCPQRLIQVRTSLKISKAEAARLLNISAMAYGRYERGEREPSYQSVCHIARTFNCNIDYLYGISNKMECDYIVVSPETPKLYSLVRLVKSNTGIEDRLLAYAERLINNSRK